MAKAKSKKADCMIEGCFQPVVSRGLCRPCYCLAWRLVKDQKTTWGLLVEAGLATSASNRGGWQSSERCYKEGPFKNALKKSKKLELGTERGPDPETVAEARQAAVEGRGGTIDEILVEQTAANPGPTPPSVIEEAHAAARAEGLMGPPQQPLGPEAGDPLPGTEAYDAASDVMDEQEKTVRTLKEQADLNEEIDAAFPDGVPQRPAKKFSQNPNGRSAFIIDEYAEMPASAETHREAEEAKQISRKKKEREDVRTIVIPVNPGPPDAGIVAYPTTSPPANLPLQRPSSTVIRPENCELPNAMEFTAARGADLMGISQRPPNEDPAMWAAVEKAIEEQAPPLQTNKYVQRYSGSELIHAENQMNDEEWAEYRSITKGNHLYEVISDDKLRRLEDILDHAMLRCSTSVFEEPTFDIKSMTCDNYRVDDRILKRRAVPADDMGVNACDQWLDVTAKEIPWIKAGHLVGLGNCKFPGKIDPEDLDYTPENLPGLGAALHTVKDRDLKEEISVIAEKLDLPELNEIVTFKDERIRFNPTLDGTVLDGELPSGIDQDDAIQYEVSDARKETIWPGFFEIKDLNGAEQAKVQEELRVAYDKLESEGGLCPPVTKKPAWDHKLELCHVPGVRPALMTREEHIDLLIKRLAFLFNVNTGNPLVVNSVELCQQEARESSSSYRDVLYEAVELAEQNARDKLEADREQTRDGGFHESTDGKQFFTQAQRDRYNAWIAATEPQGIDEFMQHEKKLKRELDAAYLRTLGPTGIPHEAVDPALMCSPEEIASDPTGDLGTRPRTEPESMRPIEEIAANARLLKPMRTKPEPMDSQAHKYPELIGSTGHVRMGPEMMDHVEVPKELPRLTPLPREQVFESTPGDTGRMKAMIESGVTVYPKNDPRSFRQDHPIDPEAALAAGSFDAPSSQSQDSVAAPGSPTAIGEAEVRASSGPKGDGSDDGDQMDDRRASWASRPQGDNAAYDVGETMQTPRQIAESKMTDEEWRQGVDVPDEP